LFDLLAVFQKVLARASKDEDLRDIFEDRFTVSDKIQFILGEMTQRSRVVFEEFFVAGASRTEIVVTFLAVLELIRLKQIGVMQDGPFGAIELIKLETPPAIYLSAEAADEREAASPDQAETVTDSE